MAELTVQARDSTLDLCHSRQVLYQHYEEVTPLSRPVYTIHWTFTPLHFSLPYQCPSLHTTGNTVRVLRPQHHRQHCRRSLATTPRAALPGFWSPWSFCTNTESPPPLPNSHQLTLIRRPQRQQAHTQGGVGPVVRPPQLHKGPLFQAANTVFQNFRGQAPNSPGLLSLVHISSQTTPPKNLSWVRAWSNISRHHCILVVWFCCWYHCNWQLRLSNLGIEYQVLASKEGKWKVCFCDSKCQTFRGATNAVKTSFPQTTYISFTIEFLGCRTKTSQLLSGTNAYDKPFTTYCKLNHKHIFSFV